MSRRAKRALLVHWLAERKQAERVRTSARQELARWYRRARLALDKGEIELARAAKEKAAEAQRAMDAASARLVEVLTELDRVRREPDERLDVDEARARATSTAEAFRELGISPQFAALEEAGYGQGLDTLLGDSMETPSPRGLDDVWAEADALLDMPMEDDHDASPQPDDSGIARDAGPQEET